MNWEGLEKHCIELKLPLLVVKGMHGILACGYLNTETLDKTGEVAAIVTGVRSFEDMVTAKVVKVSQAGEAAGLAVGMTGAEAMDKIR